MEEKKRKKKAKSTERMERKPNWQEVYATVEDIRQFLSERVSLRYNVVTRRVEVHWLTDFGDAPPELDDWEALTDRQVNSLWVELSEQKPVRVQDIYRVIESDYVAEYNPFAFYLERLPPWDGEQDHILGLSLSVNVKGDSDEQFLFAEYLKKWLVGMVAAWMNPQVVNGSTTCCRPSCAGTSTRRPMPAACRRTTCWCWHSTGWYAVRSWTRCALPN